MSRPLATAAFVVAAVTGLHLYWFEFSLAVAAVFWVALLVLGPALIAMGFQRYPEESQVGDVA